LEPAASRLRKYELFRLGGRLRTQGFTGTLIIEEPGCKTLVDFENGNPTAAESTLSTLSFPAFLLRKRCIGRDALKELLDEAASTRVRLEELLVSSGKLTQEDIARLKRELHQFVFSAAFRKGGVEYTLRPATGASNRRKASGERLDLHAALFRAVSSETDIEFLARAVASGRDTAIVRTGEFDRHLIQFRSVFLGEEISTHVSRLGATPRTVVSPLRDKEVALRQLFALFSSGMLKFAGETTSDFFSFMSGRSDEPPAPTPQPLPAAKEPTPAEAQVAAQAASQGAARVAAQAAAQELALSAESDSDPLPHTQELLAAMPEVTEEWPVEFEDVGQERRSSTSTIPGLEVDEVMDEVLRKAVDDARKAVDERELTVQQFEAPDDSFDQAPRPAAREDSAQALGAVARRSGDTQAAGPSARGRLALRIPPGVPPHPVMSEPACAVAV